MMAQLEPQNPYSRLAASALAAYPENLERAIAEGVQLKLQACEEAKRQHYHLSAYISSCSAVTYAAQLLTAGAGAALSRGTARAVVAAFEEAEASFQPIKRLLPELWVSVGTEMAKGAHRSMPQLQQFLAEPDAPQQRTTAEQGSAAAAISWQQYLPELMETRCAGCDQLAQGLRKCSRCRQVGYCR